jgi:hypothetical protein
MDVYTLAEQMGASVKLIELHNSKLTTTMAADKLAKGQGPIIAMMGLWCAECLKGKT